MRHSIARNPVDDPALRQVRTGAIRDYIEARLSERYAGQHLDFLRSVSVARRSDYDAVKVFLTKAALLDDAQKFMQSVEDQLAEAGIPTVIYVSTWMAPSGVSTGG